MSCQRLCQKAFKGNRLAIVFSVMFALNSPLLLADEHGQGSQNSSSQNSETKVMGFKMQENQMHFPEWPVKQVVVKDALPPPPLGPYMSTALNNEQTGKPHFQSMISIPVPDIEDTPMTTFSPDLPWPGDNGGTANRWTPDKGYTFVAPNVRPPQPSFAQASNQQANRSNAYQGNTGQNSVSPQRQQNHYSRPPMPASSMYNKAMNSRPVYNNAPVMRGPARPNSGANYYAPANQLRRNPSMQPRNVPANNNARYNVNPYSNAMGRPPRVDAGYNRSAYGVTRPPQMMPSSGNHR